MRKSYETSMAFSKFGIYSISLYFLLNWVSAAKANDDSLFQTNQVTYLDPYKNIIYDMGDFKISFPKGRFLLKSMNNHFSLSIGTSIQYDIGGFIGSDKKHNQPDMGGSQAVLRRARFIITIAYDNFKIIVAPDVGRGALVNDSFHEINLNYTGFHHTDLSIGLIQPSVTLLGSETSAGFTLVERPMIIDLVRNIAGANARIGFTASHWGKNYYIGASVTGQRFGKFYQDFQKNQKGGIIRAVIHPIRFQNYDLHMGVSGTVAFHGDNRRYSMNALPEAFIWPGRPYIRTGKINGVNNVWAIGPEFAFRFNRFIIQSEYYSIDLQRNSENNSRRSNLKFAGWYVSTNYVLFGQPRQYFSERAYFSAPKNALFNPAVGDWGALEWTARWSTMNLNSHRYDWDNGKPKNIHGGKQHVIATGFNWYPADQMRFSLEYNYVFATRSRNNYYNSAGRKSNILISRIEFNF